jgi:hypothetical protein
MILEWKSSVRFQPEPGKWFRLYKDLPNYREIRRKLSRSSVRFFETGEGYHGGYGGMRLRAYTAIFVPISRIDWFLRLTGGDVDARCLQAVIFS